MLRRIIRLLASSLIICFTSTANGASNTQAVPNEDALPIEIQSNSAEFDDKKGTVTYRENVIMKQGNRYLSARELIIARDPSGKIESMKAMGEPAYFYVKPEPEKPPVHGQAKNLYYFPKQDKLLLIDEAELIQNEDTIQGDHLIYFISTHVLSSQPVPGKTTTVILRSQTKSSTP